MPLQRLTTRATPKPTKAAARYTPAGGAERCGMCRHFAAPSACSRILGPVSASGWCMLFSRQVTSPHHAGQQTVLGGPPGVSLDLSFLTPGALDPRITFTRASTATYFDSTGTLQTAAANAPRWDYNPSTHALNGLLIEEARTNLWLQSGDASNVAWSKSGTAGVPVVTGNQTTAPDGTLTAARVVYPAVSAGSYSNIAQGVFASGSTYTFSVYLRGSVGGERLYLNVTADAVTYYRTQAILTTVWQRFVVVVSATTGGFFQIGTDLRDAGQTATSAQTIYVWGGQLEQNVAFPTSYIPTTAASVTRAVDRCFIAPGNMGWLVPPGGSWMAEFIGFGPGTATGERIIGRPINGVSYMLARGSTGNVVVWDGSAAVTTANGSSASTIAKAAASLTATGRAGICLNGGAVAATTGLITGFAIMASGGMYFFTGPTGTPNECMFGYLRRFRYWPRVLSDAELQSVTT